MRGLVFAVIAAAGCADHPVEVFVRVEAGGGSIRAVNPTCACDDSRYAPIDGTYEAADDGVDGCECAAGADHCALAAHIELGGETTAVERDWTGAFAGGTLVLDGCGGREELALPTVLPTAPAVTEIEEGTGVRFEWAVDANTDSIELIWTRGTGSILYHRFPAADGARSLETNHRNWQPVAYGPELVRDASFGTLHLLPQTARPHD